MEEEVVHGLVHADRIPHIIVDYVLRVVDVAGDGNCGFRVLALFLYGNEEQWNDVRQQIITEIVAYPTLYAPVFIDGLTSAVKRICYFGTNNNQSHWMQVMDDLFPICTMYNAAIFFFQYGANRGVSLQCATALPLRAYGGAQGPTREMAILHLGNDFLHYVKLDLRDGCPVPPIALQWIRNHEASVRGWDRLYAHRMQLWESRAANYG